MSIKIWWSPVFLHQGDIKSRAEHGLKPKKQGKIRFLSENCIENQRKWRFSLDLLLKYAFHTNRPGVPTIVIFPNRITLFLTGMHAKMKVNMYKKCNETELKKL